MAEKDAENETGTIFTESITKKWGRMGLLENNPGTKRFSYFLEIQGLS